MKTKKHILRFSVIAGILACLLIAGSLFASGTDVTADKVNVVVTAPASAVSAGDSFDVSVAITNEDISSFLVAGVQVELAYDAEKLTAGDITATLDTTESTVASKAAEGTVKFVCVKNEFTDDAGYTTLNDLFKVEFTANADIANPAKLFNNDSVQLLLGSTEALKIEEAQSIYGADKAKIAEAILNSGLQLTPTDAAGTVVIVPTPTGKVAKTATELAAAINNTSVTITDNNGIIGTGAKISVEGEEVELVVMGDVDGDGIVTVFDANIMLEGAGNTDAQKYASDLNGDAAVDGADTEDALAHIVGTDPIA